jgi:subtilisin-like proprotein convertase family protein
MNYEFDCYEISSTLGRNYEYNVYLGRSTNDENRYSPILNNYNCNGGYVIASGHNRPSGITNLEFWIRTTGDDGIFWDCTHGGDCNGSWVSTNYLYRNFPMYNWNETALNASGSGRGWVKVRWGNYYANPQSDYGNGEWVGAFYDDANLTTYRGYITESETFDTDFPNVNENDGSQNYRLFGADNVTNQSVNYVYTESFSAKYRMTKNFSQCGAYSFTVGADDGYRLIIDGITYIDNWTDGGYRTTTAVVYLASGNHNLELQYYDGGGGNRLSFAYSSLDTWTATANASATTVCSGGNISLLGGTTGTVIACNTRVNTPNASIPDNNTNGVNGYIQVQGTGISASAITSVALNISHTWNSDVTVTLYAPDGSNIVICGAKGGSGDNITATLVTTGTALPTTNTTINGTFQVQTAFSGLTGSADGLWRLNVKDGASNDVGTFNSWTLNLNSTCSATYSWSGPNSFSSTSQNPIRSSATTSDAGTYTVLVTQGGCTKTNTVNITVRPVLDPSSAAANLASCQLNSTAPYADLTANAAPSGAQGTWAVTTAPGTVTSPNANNTQVTGLSNTGATSTLSWSLSYTSGLACTVAKTGINITPLNLATTLNSVSLQNDGAASSTGTPAQTRYACRTCSVKDGNTYTYYDAIGKIIATIVDKTSNAADLGSTEVCIGYDYTPPTAPNSGNVKTITDNFGRTQPYLPRSWTIKPAAGSDATVTLYFTADELSALQSRASTTPYAFSGLDLAVTKYPGGTGNGQFIAPKTAGGVFTPSVFGNYNSDYKVTFDVNSFSTFYVHPQMYPFAPLPVELVSFTGYNDKDKNVLNWTTASEKNSDRFEIEKSTIGTGDWKYIGWQKAVGEQGATNYTFSDNQPVVGNNYYRLKIIDNDGTYTYSNTINISVNAAMVNGFVKVFPNPTNGLVTIQLQSTKNAVSILQVTNLLGQVVKSSEIALSTGVTQVSLDMHELPNGTYLVSFVDVLGTRHLEKIVKQ